MFHRCPFDANIQAVYFKIVTDNEVDLILSSSGDNAGLECPSVSYAVNKINGVFQHGVSTPAAASNVTAIGGTNVVTNTTTTSLDSIYVKENTYSDPLVAVDPSGLGGTLTGRYWGQAAAFRRSTPSCPTRRPEALIPAPPPIARYPIAACRSVDVQVAS